MKILVLGATGSIGRLVVGEALKAGHDVHALVRQPARARVLPEGVTLHIGDVTDPASLKPAVAGVDGVICTLGSDGMGKLGAETVDYGGIRNLLAAIETGRPHITLMTAIGVTNREGAYNRQTQSHDWKRRAERLVRASGLPYTIVRPGWFDYNGADEMLPVFLQGDRRHAGDPSDGAIARGTLARVLVQSLGNPVACGKSFELVSAHGFEPQDLMPLFAALDADQSGALDGVRDLDNQPLAQEPPSVREALAAEQKRADKRRVAGN